MRILIGCEFSGVLREAFAAQGHDAWSCDLLPTEQPGQHIQGNVLDVLNDGWDAAFWFPPCTYLCSSGLHWNTRRPERAAKTETALDFVQQLMNTPVPFMALENPIGCISTRIRKPDQVVQPYQFGEDASKATCLWLKGLPPLVPTDYVAPRMVNGKPRWSNQTDSGQNRLAPSEKRWMQRSITYQGVANAMAVQWTAAMEGVTQ